MAGYSKKYRENRQRVLASNPMCVYCKRRKANTVDHVIEKDRGGSDDLDNLVPACGSCNSKKGAQYGNAKRGARTAARGAAARKASDSRSSAFFSDESVTPSDHSPSLSLKKRKGAEGGGSEPIEAGRPQFAPRLETPRWGSASHGADLAAWTERHLGVELMGWQRWAADGLLEVDGPGQFRNRIGLISVARQNGKSTLMVGLIGWAMTEGAILRGGPQTVVLTANTLDTASLMFKQVEPILVERFGGKSYKSFGRQEVELANGSVLIARAASESIGHGRSVDLAVVDEVWQVPAEAINAGLLPAQRARWNPMLAMFSTAGTAKSEAMIGWREKGLAAIQGGTPSGLYMAEWSLGEADPEDRSAWHLANPALLEDRLPISIEAMELERQTYDWGEFCRASLNLWVANDNPWLRTGTWEQLSVDDELPAPQVIALEASAEDSRFSAVAAGRLPDGRTMVWVAFMVGNDADAWQKIRDLAGPNTVIAVPGSLEIRIPPDLRRRSTIVGYAEINRWTKGVTFDIYNAKVVHRGDVALSDHVARAVAVVHNGDPALSSKRSTGSIALARCMVWAVTLARRPVATGRPTVATSRR